MALLRSIGILAAIVVALALLLSVAEVQDDVETLAQEDTRGDVQR